MTQTLEAASTLARLTGTTFHIEATPGCPDGEWYAAFRQAGAEDMDPELAYAYGATQDEAAMAAGRMMAEVAAGRMMAEVAAGRSLTGL